MSEIKVALEYAAGLALVFAASWVWRSRKDRSRGLIMGSAFVVMAAILFGYGNEWPLGLILGLVGLLVFLLLIDFGMRAGRKVEKE
ncbi:MAG: hypothetical protein ACKVQS_06660 [Fimbriimonadaceae bacterium]